MVNQKYRFLMIGDTHNGLWQRMLAEATAPLGELEIAGPLDALDLIEHHDYDVIIIDAVQVQDVYVLVRSLHRQKPAAKIIVVTSSPTWRRAREAYRAGAVDYIRKTTHREDILTTLQTALGLATPRSRRYQG